MSDRSDKPMAGTWASTQRQYATGPGRSEPRASSSRRGQHSEDTDSPPGGDTPNDAVCADDAPVERASRRRHNAATPGTSEFERQTQTEAYHSPLQHRPHPPPARRGQFHPLNQREPSPPPSLRGSQPQSSGSSSDALYMPRSDRRTQPARNAPSSSVAPHTSRDNVDGGSDPHSSSIPLTGTDPGQARLAFEPRNYDGSGSSSHARSSDSSASVLEMAPSNRSPRPAAQEQRASSGDDGDRGSGEERDIPRLRQGLGRMFSREGPSEGR